MRRYSIFLLAGLLLSALWRASYIVGALDPAQVVRAICGGLLLDLVLLAMVGGLVLFLRSRRGLVWILATGLVLVVFAAILFVRVADGVYFLYAGDHFDIIALRHAKGEAAGMEFDGPGITYLAVGLSGLVVQCVFAVLLARGPVGAWFGGYAGVTGVVGVVLGAAWLGLGFAGDAPPAQRYRLALLDDIPTWIVFDRMRQIAAMDEMVGAARFRLDPGVRRKLRKFGIEVADEKEFPLVRERSFDQPFPFAKSADAEALPNVIVVFFESFSAAFTSVYNSARFPGLTPNLEDFARQAHVIEDFFNSTTPTMMSVSCTYCSYLPPTNTSTWDSVENGSGKTRVRCLPHVLRENGYRTVHLHQLPNSFVGTGRAMARIGFERVLDEAYIRETLGEDMGSGWGYSDDQLMRCFVQLLKEMEGAGQPFLLSTATFDSHAPFHEVKGQFYGDGESPLLNSIHGADDAFGTFWRAFQASPLAKDTIVVLLADHAMLPGRENSRLRSGEDVAGRRYDRTLFAVHAQMFEGFVGRSKIVAGSVDVAPTILHMLDLDARTHFEGHSVFGSRTLFPELLGMNEYLFATYQKVGGAYVLRNFELEAIEKIYDPARFEPGSDVLNEHEFFHYYKWKKAIHANNLVWPFR